MIRTGHDCDVTVDGLVVRNKGYEIEEITDGAEFLKKLPFVDIQ